MIKTQIQLPENLYEEAKRVAREREMSLAEVVRRGVEYITRVYPPVKQTGSAWELPGARDLGSDPDVPLGKLRDLLIDDESLRTLGE